MRTRTARHVGGAHSLGGLSRQQRDLDAARETKLLLDPLFVASHFLVEARVVDGHSRLARQQRQQLLMFFAEGIELRTLQIEHADAAILLTGIGIDELQRASATRLM